MMEVKPEPKPKILHPFFRRYFELPREKVRLNKPHKSGISDKCTHLSLLYLRFYLSQNYGATHEIQFLFSAFPVPQATVLLRHDFRVRTVVCLGLDPRDLQGALRPELSDCFLTDDCSWLGRDSTPGVNLKSRGNFNCNCLNLALSRCEFQHFLNWKLHS